MSDVFSVSFRLNRWRRAYGAHAHALGDGQRYQPKQPVDTFTRSIMGPASVELGQDVPVAFSGLNAANVTIAASRHWRDATWIEDQHRAEPFLLGTLSTLFGNVAGFIVNLPLADFDWLFPQQAAGSVPRPIQIAGDFRMHDDSSALLMRYEFGELS